MVSADDDDDDEEVEDFASPAGQMLPPPVPAFQSPFEPNVSTVLPFKRRRRP